MKLSFRLPRVNLFWGLTWDSPLLLFDVYKHTFTFVTVEDPRQEIGISFVVSLLKFRVILALYVDRPYAISEDIAFRLRTRKYTKKP